MVVRRQPPPGRELVEDQTEDGHIGYETTRLDDAFCLNTCTKRSHSSASVTRKHRMYNEEKVMITEGSPIANVAAQ